MLSLLEKLKSLPLATRAMLLAALMAGLGAVYAGPMLLAPAAVSTAGSCARPDATKVAAFRQLATGEMAAVQIAAQPNAMPKLAFNASDGTPRTLADFKGRTVLLNLWATWCAPCRKEMPALDALQAELGGPDFEVVAINIDTRNLEKPREWLRENNISRLAYYGDPQAAVFQALKTAGKAVGMPTTLLIDGRGCELALLHGPAEWASADGKKLIRAALGR
ncbi:MAG: thiol:disulfide interchange protein TlpA [Bosea sp. (in: a-proteobacteria)]